AQPFVNFARIYLVVDAARASQREHLLGEIDAHEMTLFLGEREPAFARAAAEVQDVQRSSGRERHNRQSKVFWYGVAKGGQPGVERRREVIEGRSHPAIRSTVR